MSYSVTEETLHTIANQGHLDALAIILESICQNDDSSLKAGQIFLRSLVEGANSEIAARTFEDIRVINNRLAHTGSL